VNIVARVRAALTTFPRASGWLRLLFELAWLAPILTVFGLMGGLVDPAPINPLTVLRFAAIALLVPALAEEIVFRAILLPAGGAASLVGSTLAVAAFVAWHPLQVLWFGQPWGQVVLNPWFLAAVVALGIATTRLYLLTASLWPSVILHWVAVVAWKALGGASPWG
jgi:predicted Abi (CAAX) family protease